MGKNKTGRWLVFPIPAVMLLGMLVCGFDFAQL